MNAALSTRSAFAGQQLQQQARHSAKHAKRMTCLAVKKLNSYDEGWNKGARRDKPTQPEAGAAAGCLGYSH